MQSVSSRIWTLVAVSISYDDNHYTTGTSKSVKFIVVRNVIRDLSSYTWRIYLCSTFHWYSWIHVLSKAVGEYLGRLCFLDFFYATSQEEEKLWIQMSNNSS